MFGEKTCFDVLCTCKAFHSVKWRSLFGDTATMQELLLKACTSSAWRKRSPEGNCHCIVYGTGLHHSLTGVSRSTAQKIMEEKKKAQDEQQQPKQPPSSMSKV